MADILISQLPAGSPLLTDLLILANPSTGIAKKSTVTQLNNVLSLAGLSDVTQSPSNNSFLEYDGGNFNYVTNVVRATGLNVGIIPFLESIGPLNLSSSQLYQGAYGIEISEDQYLNNASVLFGLSSNSKGFLMPRLASTDRIDISLPPKGLEVFDSTLNIPYFYNGTAWKGVQEVLLSGTNIKTVNGNSILGSGNLAIGGITTLNTLTASTQTFATSTTGTDFTISSSTSTHTFNMPTASASARGLLSSSNWTTFNNKVGGSGTTNYLSKFTASGTIGNSLIYDNGVGIEINGPTNISTASQYVLSVGNSTGPTSTSSFVLGNAGYYYTTINAIRPGGNFATNLTFTTCASGSPTAIEAMRITSDQKLLIGRTTDDGSGAQLQVYGNINAPYIIASNDLYGNNVRVNGIYPNTLTYLPFLSNQSPYGEIMRVNNNGSLWINRTTDDGTGAKLQVNGGFSQNGANDYNYFAGKTYINKTVPYSTNHQFEVNGNSLLGYAYVGLVYGTSNEASFSEINRSGAGNYSFLSTSDGNTFINAKTGYNVYFRINNDNKMIVDSGGTILIGTTTPTSRKLVVAGEQEWNNITFGTGAHTTSGNHLPIWVNGTKYWLALLNSIV